MTTIRQLAQIAGVSHSTVSRALRGDRSISADTRKQLQELAQLYHYSSHRRMHATFPEKRTVIGCLLSDVSHPFESRMLRGILHAAYLDSYQVIPLETNLQLSHTRQAIATLLEQHVSGMIIVSCAPEPVPQSVLLELRSRDVPMVAMDYTKIAGKVDYICTDERHLADTAINFFSQLGHSSIAYLGPTVDDYRGRRTRAVIDALQRRGLSCRYVADWECTHYSAFDQHDVLRRLLSLSPAPTAILCWEDGLACRVIHLLQRMGVQVPRDISVLGCSNLNVAEFMVPSLSSIEQFPEEMGRTACQRLLEYLLPDEPLIREHTTIHIPVSLVKRDSCAQAAQ